MKRSRKQADEFTIAWVCALPIELSAATVVLDEQYDDIPELAQYVLGRVGSHDVVVACLPAGQYGTNAAAVTAAELHSKFSRIQCWLMVGIGGGVPSITNDIRLGDVVVSQPQNQHGGVIQYDLGKSGPDGHNIRTGVLNAPPAVLGRAVSRMRSAYDIGRGRLQAHLAAFSRLPKFARPKGDTLFEADYRHVGLDSCQDCSPDRIIARPERVDDDAFVHFGLIASGNQVIRDGTRRDKLSADLGGALCFEMEAAGLVNYFPCLVIRGICDYSDSHKNKQAQPFAAASAAACAKEVLSYVSSMASSTIEVQARSLQRDLTGSVVAQQMEFTTLSHESEIVSDSDDSDTTTEAPFVKLALSENQKQQFLESLAFEEINARHATIRPAHATTCKWILKRQEYLSWLNEKHLPTHHGFFWVKGNPGTGKSTLMKFLLAKVSKAYRNAMIVSFFFNARGESLEKTTAGMYRSILFQILGRYQEMQEVFTLYRPKKSSTMQFLWDIDTLKAALEYVVSRLKSQPLLIFIDALDECGENEIRDMVSMFEALGSMAVANRLEFRTCFSSRHYPHVTINNSIQLILEDQDDHNQDIAQYLHTELKAGHDEFVNDIRSEMLQRSSGIFLWVVLVVQILNLEFSRGNKHTMKQKLNEIPDGLEKLFEDILTRDNQKTAQLVACLQWVLFANRPLRVEELYFALLTNPDIDHQHYPDISTISQDDMRRFLLNTSKGLVEETKSKSATVQFIHESVRDFFLKGKGLNTPFFGPRTDFKARSHDRLKQCCDRYIQNVYVSIRNDSSMTKDWRESDSFAITLLALPKASTDEAKDLRQRMLAEYPFLRYAVDGVLYHCDQASSSGLNQTTFITDFELKRWMYCNNLLEIHQIRRYTAEASLLYIIADRGLSHLVEVEYARTKTIEVFGERWQFPLIAAQAADHEEVMRNLITCELQSRDDLGSDQIEHFVDNLRKRKAQTRRTDTLLLWALRSDIKSLWKVFVNSGSSDQFSLWKSRKIVAHEVVRNGHGDFIIMMMSRPDLRDMLTRELLQKRLLFRLIQHDLIDVTRLVLEYADATEPFQSEIEDYVNLGLSQASAFGKLSFVKLFLTHNPDPAAVYDAIVLVVRHKRHPDSSSSYAEVMKYLIAHFGGVEVVLRAANAQDPLVVQSILELEDFLKLPGDLYGSLIRSVSREPGLYGKTIARLLLFKHSTVLLPASDIESVSLGPVKPPLWRDFVIRDYHPRYDSREDGNAYDVVPLIVDHVTNVKILNRPTSTRSVTAPGNANDPVAQMLDEEDANEKWHCCDSRGVLSWAADGYLEGLLRMILRYGMTNPFLRMPGRGLWKDDLRRYLFEDNDEVFHIMSSEIEPTKLGLIRVIIEIAHLVVVGFGNGGDISKAIGRLRELITRIVPEDSSDLAQIDSSAGLETDSVA